MTSTAQERTVLSWWNLALIAAVLLMVVVLAVRELTKERLIRQRVEARELEVRHQLEQEHERRMRERIEQEVTRALAKVEQRVRVGLPAAAQRARGAIEERNYGDALVSLEALQEALAVAEETGADLSVTKSALQDLVQALQGISPDVPDKARQVLSQIEALASKT